VTRPRDERHYVRAVETAWSQTLGRPVVVSPREFEAVEAWRRRGVPLAIVLEVITASKRRSGRAPQSLTALTPAVLEAWGVIAAGRAAPHITEELPERSDARRSWQDALDRCPEGGRLHAVLSTLLAEEAGGQAAERIDAALDAALPDSVPEETLRCVTADTERGLEGFRGRMHDEEFQRMFARARADRLRAELKLPRLKLTR